MRALVYTGPKTLGIEEVPMPLAVGDEVLVRVEACGICGSDMHAYRGEDPHRPPKVILGHEVAGTIVGGMRDGERVAVNPLVSCGTCEYCNGGRPQSCLKREIISKMPRPGGFAEFVSIPGANAYPIPDGLSFRQAALAEPIAVSWHAVEVARSLMFRPLERARCCVIGGGAIGVAAGLVLLFRGARVVFLSDPNEARRNQARLAAKGNISIFDPRQGERPADGSMDLIIDCVGSPASRADASRLAGRGAVIAHVGILEGGPGLDTRRVTIEEHIFVGTYCYTPEEFRAVIAAMANGGLGTLDWFDARPLESGPEAFRELDSGAAETPKIMLLPRDVAA